MAGSGLAEELARRLVEPAQGILEPSDGRRIVA
jgi:hypothetical protein